MILRVELVSEELAEHRQAHSWLLQERLAGTRLTAGLVLRMTDHPVLDLSLGLVVQVVISGPRIGELS
jgi:hypothetical protein